MAKATKASLAKFNEALRKLERKGPDDLEMWLYVLDAISAAKDPELRASAFLSGAADFLARKPWMDEYANTVASVIASKAVRS